MSLGSLAKQRAGLVRCSLVLGTIDADDESSLLTAYPVRQYRSWWVLAQPQ